MDLKNWVLYFQLKSESIQYEIVLLLGASRGKWLESYHVA